MASAIITLRKYFANGSAVSCLENNSWYFSKDGGNTFSNKTPSGIQFVSVAYQNGGVYALGRNAPPSSSITLSMYSSSDGGNTFSPLLVSPSMSAIIAQTRSISISGANLFPNTGSNVYLWPLNGSQAPSVIATAPPESTYGKILTAGNVVVLQTSFLNGLYNNMISLNSGQTFSPIQINGFPNIINGLPNVEVTSLLVSGSVIAITATYTIDLNGQEVPGVFVSNTGTNSFTASSGTPTPLQNYELASGTGVIYLGNGQGLYASTDGGNTFTLKASANQVPYTPYGVGVSGNNIIVAALNGLFVSYNGGSAFQEVPNTGTSYNAVGVSGNSVYALAGGAVLETSMDGGNTFSRQVVNQGAGYLLSMSVGTYYEYLFPGSLSVYAIAQIVQTNVQGTLSQLLTLPANTRNISAAGANLYIILQSPGQSQQLEVSTNGGQTFSPLYTLSSASYVSASYISSNFLSVSGQSLYLATSSGVLVSTNGGQTFSNLPAFGSSASGVVANGNLIASWGASGVSVSADGGVTASSIGPLPSSNVQNVVLSSQAIYVSTLSGIGKYPIP